MPLQNYPFARNGPLPSFWANAIQSFISTLVSNFALSAVPGQPTQIQVVASAGDGLVAIAIKGCWRWIEQTITRAHPGGAAGSYDVFVTASANSITQSPNPYTDSTQYAFALAIVPAGQAPAVQAGVVDIYRKVGSAQWNGSAITQITNLVGPQQPPAGPAGGDLAGLGDGASVYPNPALSASSPNLPLKPPVRAAASSNVSIASAPSSIDGVVLAAGDRVLLVGQTDQTQNGVYTFNGAGAAMTRGPASAISAHFVRGFGVHVLEGSAFTGANFIYTGPANPVLGTSALTFARANGLLGPRLAVARDRPVDMGSGTVHFAASGVSNVVAVPHNLGVVPLGVVFGAKGNQIILDWGAETASQFSVQGWISAATTADIVFSWWAWA